MYRKHIFTIFLVFGAVFSSFSLALAEPTVAHASAASTVQTQVQTTNSDTLNRLDKKGRKQGRWVIKDTTRRLFYEGIFKDDMPKGHFVYTDHQGLKVAEAFYFRGGYASFNKFFYPTGELLSSGYYLDKQKDSIWTYYRQDSSKIKTEQYQKGKLNGKVCLFNQKGEEVECIRYFRGQRHGKWYSREENGFQKGEYQLGLSHGEYGAYYKDSSAYIKGFYFGGCKDSVWSFYLPSPESHLYKKEYYKENKLIKRELYLKIEGELRVVSMDTLACVFLNQEGKADIFTQNDCLHCDDSYEIVCDILDLDYFFYANPNVFVSFAHISSFDEESGKLEIKIKLPFPIYVDEDAKLNLKSLYNTQSVGLDNE